MSRDTARSKGAPGSGSNVSVRPGGAPEYRRFLACLLVWSVLPLPFSGIVLAPFWLAALAAAAHLWWRPPLRLGTALQNLAGLVILVAVVLARGLAVGPLRPLGHLLLLLTAVRALMVEDRRSFFRTAPAVALIWVVSVASSTHISLALYLLGSTVILWWTGMYLLLTGLPASPAGGAGRVPRPRPVHALAGGIVSLALAVPVFLGLPRLPTPWIAVGGGSRAVSGFADAVQLSRVGEIRESREEAIVIRSIDGSEIQPRWTRLRATAFDLVRTGMWTPRRNPLVAPELRNGTVWLQPDRGSLRGTSELELMLVKPSRYLFLPEGTIALSCPIRVVIDPVGGILVGQRRLPPQLRYRVWVTPQPAVRLQEPSNRDTFLPNSSANVARIARTVAAGERDSAALAASVADYLRSSYRYTTSNPERFVTDPVEWFLMEGRAGHCEMFAGSMVVLLRHLGVPARMVGGYLGGTVAESQREVRVGENNAHTWVEVWLGDELGWRVFDPTPAEGVPELDPLRGMKRLQWLWDRVSSIWDRYVLTFGSEDQLSLLADSWQWLGDQLQQLRLRHLLWLITAPAALWAGLVLLLRGLRWYRSRRAGTPAVLALGRLLARLVSAGVEVPASATWRRVAVLAAARWPGAAVPVHELVGLAEQELYSPGTVCSLTRARSLWQEVRHGMKNAGCNSK